MINSHEEIIAQIKELSLSVTENTYYSGIQRGYGLLVKLHNLDIEKECVYQALFQYYNSLEDSPSRDFIADILDYAVGWCSPEKQIWDTDKYAANALLKAQEAFEGVAEELGIQNEQDVVKLVKEIRAERGACNGRT